MSSSTVILKLQGEADLSKMVTALKGVATESKNAETGVKNLEKGSTSLTSKISSLGSKFSGTITNVATLGGTVVNLKRQYDDLGDSQIRVDQKQLKLSKSTEAVKTAQSKLQALISKGIRSGAEYEKAQLDVTQALDQQKLAQTLLGEAIEDQQRAQENFWIGLVPAITSAGGTIVSVFKEIGGTKGFGGLKNVIAGLIGTGVGGIGSIGPTAAAQIPQVNKLKSALGGIMGAGGLAGIAGGVGVVGGIALGGLIGAQQLNQNVKEFRDIATVTRLKYEAFLKTLGFGDAQIKSTMAVYDQLRNTLGITATDVETLNTKSTEGYKKWILELRTAKQPLTDVVSEMQKWGFTNKEISTTIADVDAEMRKLNGTTQSAVPTIEHMANNVRFLDANLQPLPPVIQQLGSALEIANASLAASGSGLSNLQAGLNSGTAAAAAWVAQSEKQIATDQAFQVSLFKTAQAMQIKTATEDDSVEILQLLIQRTQAMEQGNYDLVTSLDALIKKQRQANQVAAQGVGKYVHGRGVVGQGPKGSRYVTFAGGKVIGSGPGMAPPLVGGTRGGQGYGTIGPGFGVSPIGTIHRKPGAKGYKKKPNAQFGMHEFLTEDMDISAHAGERVDIDKPTRGGGGRPIIVKVYFGTQELKQFIRYTVNEDQGSWR